MAILSAELSDGEWYLTSDHPMRREHYLSFAALVNEDTVVLRRRYPEWGAQTRLPYFAHGTLLWYCTRHGLFAQKIDAHKKWAENSKGVPERERLCCGFGCITRCR